MDSNRFPIILLIRQEDTVVYLFLKVQMEISPTKVLQLSQEHVFLRIP